MDPARNEPSLAPSADSPAEKHEKVRAGRRLVLVVGLIAAIFLIACFGIIGYWFFAAASQ